MSSKKYIWCLFVANLACSFVFFVFYYNIVLVPFYSKHLTNLVQYTDSNNVSEYSALGLDVQPDNYTKPAEAGKAADDIKQGEAESLNRETAEVTSIIDGDTIRAKVGGIIEKIRLLAIDTPETKDPRKPVQCFGREATEKLTGLLENKVVLLEEDASQGSRDKYGRLLRYVYLVDGTNINATMVKEGYAFAYRKYPTKQLDQMIELENTAKGNQAGLWNPNSCNGEVG